MVRSTRSLTAVPILLLLACGGGGGGAGPDPARTFTVSGTVVGPVVYPVQMSMPVASNSTHLTDINGLYAFTEVPPGTYTISTVLFGGVSTPPSITVTVVDRDVVVPPFTTPATYTVDGSIGGADVEGAVLTLTGSVTLSTAADAGGGYQCPDVPAGAYTITPSHPYYTFDPPSAWMLTGFYGPIHFSAVPKWRAWKSTGVGLGGLWGSGPNDVWAVGGGGTILHWDGVDWISVGSDTAAALSSVWGSGPNDVWAVGAGGAIVHWDGAAWRSVPSGTSSPLASVSGTGPADVWAVGGQRNLESVVLHWDGLAWTPVWGSTQGYLSSVWAAGPADVWAVGASYSAFNTLNGFALHWDGLAFSELPSFLGAGTLSGVWGAGPDDAWMVGEASDYLHLTGGTWWNMSSLMRDEESPLTVWGSGPLDVWAGGALSTFYGLSGHLLAHWDGTRGRAVTTEPTHGVSAIWGSGPDDIWAVERGGTILRYRR